MSIHYQCRRCHMAVFRHGENQYKETKYCDNCKDAEYTGFFPSSWPQSKAGNYRPWSCFLAAGAFLLVVYFLCNL